jgi:hypothetical protein
VSLFDAPPFAALSYCWGALNDQVRITVNGLGYQVTSNLHAALTRLRKDGVERVWVDAICINQQDLEERSHQVKRMGAIYQEAYQVVVWLGNAQDEADKDIASLSITYDSIFGPARWSISARRAFYHLLLKPYWTRVWIIQEIASASNIVVFCGPHKISWESLEELSHPSFNVGEEGIKNQESIARLQNLLQSRNDRLNTKPVRLIDAISRSRHALSTDPKDKIYGLLGLAYDGAIFIPEPNYRQSVEDT